MDENTKAELYKMYARAMKMMPGSSQQKELVKKIGALRKKLGMNEERDYKAEYKKFQSSTKSKKYRAELNKYNRKKGTYGNGDGKDASHKGGKIVGFESQSKNRGRAEKSRLKQESLIYEIPASVFSAAAAVKLKNKAGKEVSAATAAKSDYAKKDPATHKKAKSIFQRLKDKFAKKKDEKPKKQSKSDADFYKRQYAGESVNEGVLYEATYKQTYKSITARDKDSLRIWGSQIGHPRVTVRSWSEVGKTGRMKTAYIEVDGDKAWVDAYKKIAFSGKGNFTDVVKSLKESVNEGNNIDKIKDIVKRKQYKKIDGVMVDMQTANVIMKVWDALGQANRKKFEKLPIKQMANVAWKLMK
jgi:hypothetical protein